MSFKIGVLGAGSIANKVCETVAKIDGFQIYAVASRTEISREAFAEKFNTVKTYETYEELAEDKDVDLIYVATPHSHHYEHTMLCLNAGRNCLVEKAFSYNAKTAKEMIALAKEKKLFLGEAYWSRYNPMYKKIKDILDAGEIGEVSTMSIDFGYDINHKTRIVSPELAGGSLLDIGIYPIGFATYLFGYNMQPIFTNCKKFSTGMDSEQTIFALFPREDGKDVTVHIFCTANYGPERVAKIYGTKGYIKIEEFSCPNYIEIYKNSGELVKRIEPEEQISGYEYEFIAAREAIEKGEIEAADMTHQETIDLMETLDDFRKRWDIKYPFEVSI